VLCRLAPLLCLAPVSVSANHLSYRIVSYIRAQ